MLSLSFSRSANADLLKPSSMGALTVAFSRAAARAGIENFRFHDLRHTTGTRMADAGADLITIAAVLGHTTLERAARYTHATDMGTRKAVEALSGWQQRDCHNIVTMDLEQRKEAAS